MGKAREYKELRAIHYLRRDIAYNTAGIATGVLVGTIPNGAIPTRVRLVISTGFNDSGTDTLSVGHGASYNEYFNAQDASSATVVDSTITNLVEVTADKDIYVKYAGQNSNASAGAATVIVEYTIDNDQ
ncbi:MAG: hypothetical protein AB1405_07820 [Bdellovibrionota bacterium]